MPRPSAAEIAAARLPLPRASSLPPGCYLDPEVFAREEERIFRREWLCVGRVDQLEQPGDYFAFDLLGDPLVAVRGDDGLIRVLSRVCRHRSMPVVEGRGNRRSFQCPYHRWTYALDGRLLGAPDMERAEGFERERCRLPELRVETWLGWIFASFDPGAAPLAPRLEGLRRVVERYRPEAMRALFARDAGPHGRGARALRQRDSLIWYRLEPHAVDRFTLHIHPCVPPPRPGDGEHAAKLEALCGWLDGVHRQDIAACQGVQRGLRSRLARPGRLSHLEKALWQFDQFVLDRVAPEPA